MLPWSQIISAGFTLADLARSIYGNTKKNKEKGNTVDLNKRIELLEKYQVKQAELMTHMAEQHQLMLEKTRRYFIITVIASIISLLCIGFLIVAYFFVFHNRSTY